MIGAVDLRAGLRARAPEFERDCLVVAVLSILIRVKVGESLIDFTTGLLGFEGATGDAETASVGPGLAGMGIATGDAESSSVRDMEASCGFPIGKGETAGVRSGLLGSGSVAGIPMGEI